MLYLTESTRVGEVKWVCTEHAEAAGMLKLKINNPYWKRKKLLKMSHASFYHKRQGSESRRAYKNTDKSVKNWVKKRGSERHPQRCPAAVCAPLLGQNTS